MNDTIKKLAMEWKRNDNAYKQSVEKNLEANFRYDTESACTECWKQRGISANVLAMAIAQELGL